MQQTSKIPGGLGETTKKQEQQEDTPPPKKPTIDHQNKQTKYKPEMNKNQQQQKTPGRLWKCRFVTV